MTRTACVILAVSLTTMSFGRCEGDDPVASVVDLLKKAQDANEGRYPSGRIRVQMRKGQRDRQNPANNRHEIIDAQVQWSGDDVRTELVRWGPSVREPDLNEPTADREVCLLNRTSSTMYHHTPRVTISPIAGTEVSSEYRLAPRGYWYLSQLSPDYPCLKAFLPGKNSPASEPNAVVASNRETDGNVRLSLHKATKGSSLVATYSYDLDGNVVRFALDSSSTGLKIDGKYDWGRDTRGRVYLRKLDKTMFTTPEGEVLEVYESCEVIEFDPDFVPGRDAFELSSLNLRVGTIVDDQVSGRKYQTGDRPTAAVSESFDDLIARMRSRGFSSSSRH